jgi:hypothetical protein
MPPSLINFNVSATIRQRFDAICHASGRTRTSVLVELMTNYVLDQGARLADQARRLASIEQDFAISCDLKRHRGDQRHSRRHDANALVTAGRCEFEPPGFDYSDGREEW